MRAITLVCGVKRGRLRSFALAVGAAAGVLTGASGAAAKVTITATAPAAPTLQTATACFTATGPDGQPMRLFGRRYEVGAAAVDRPAIVLVHGVATTADISWDPTPSRSLARWLAYAGYTVFTYDRPGYGRSPYTGIGGGDALTVDANQVALHDVIGAVHNGTYATGPATGSCAPEQLTAPTGAPSRRVAIIGHSGGGFIVSTYPGRYHDVVAMVQANAPSGVMSVDPAGNAALQSDPQTDANNEAAMGPIGDASADGPAAPVPAGYTGGTDRAACENFNFWRAGAIRELATHVCNPANFVPLPNGETRSYYNQAAANNATIRQTGDIPVLLAGADHDHIMPGDANALELSAWQETCGCDVSQFVLQDTGHFFAGHQSLVEWTSRVTDWLTAKGSPTAVPDGVRAGVFPPVACGPVRVTAVLGVAGTRARRVSISAGTATRKLAGRRRAIAITTPADAMGPIEVVVSIRSRSGRLITSRRAVRPCVPLT